MDSYSIIQNLNNSKFFAGILMILMNIGSKYISLELSETQDEFFSNIVIRRIMIFVVIFIATKDIIISIIITSCFVILVSGLFNENSKFCLIKNNCKQTKVISKEKVEKAKKILRKYEEQEFKRKNNIK
tara:strand:+ start:673 stop:1059 length:387 start_codon:yes stop_codon:yes gene_type:complete